MSINLILVFLISLCTSVLVQFVLRQKGRRDYAQNEKKLSHQSKLLEQILRKQGEKWVQNIKDGILEYKTLFHQGHEKRSLLQSTLEETTKKIQILEKDQPFLTEMSTELQHVLTQTEKITGEMETLEEALRRGAEARTFMNEIEERMSQIEKNLVLQTDKTQNLIENLNRQLIADSRTAENAKVEIQKISGKSKNEFQMTLRDSKENIKTQVEKVMQQCLEIFHHQVDERKKNWDTLTRANSEKSQERHENALKKIVQHTQDQLGIIQKENLQRLNAENQRLQTNLQNASKEITHLEDIRTSSREQLENMTTQLQTNVSLNEKWQTELRQAQHTMPNLLAQIKREQEILKENFQEQNQEAQAIQEKLMERHIRELSQGQKEFAHFMESTVQKNQANMQKTMDIDLQKKSDDILKQIVEVEIQETIVAELQTQGDKQMNRVKGLFKENTMELTELSEKKLAQITMELDKIQSKCTETLDAIKDSESEAQKQIEHWQGIRSQALREQDTWKQKILKIANEAETKYMAQIQSQWNATEITGIKRIEEQIQRIESDWLKHWRENVKEQHTEIESNVIKMEKEFQEIKEKGNQNILIQKENLQKINKETEQLRQSITELRKGLPTLKKANHLRERLDQTVNTLTEKLEVAQREHLKLDQISIRYEDIRDQRKELAESISVLMQEYKAFKKKEKIIRKLDGRFDRVDEAKEITEELQNQISQIHELKESTDSYLAKLEAGKEKMDDLNERFHESETKTLQTIRAAGQAKKALDKFDYRQDEILKNVSHLEKRSNHLQKLESNILKVESRFEQMDTLLLDLEEKQKQTSLIGATFREYRIKSDGISQELTSLIGEAEEKMDKLVTFYEMIDSNQESHNREILEKIGHKPHNSQSNKTTLTRKKKENILALYHEHQWDETLIAKKLKVEPSIIRTVLATSKKS